MTQPPNEYRPWWEEHGNLPWQNKPSEATAIIAEALNRIEAGIKSVTTWARSAAQTLTDLSSNKADKTTSVSAGEGLTGGGTLAETRTLRVDFGTGHSQVLRGDQAADLPAGMQAGDLLVGDANGRMIRLTKGADDTQLKINRTTHLPEWMASSAGASLVETTVKGRIAATKTSGVWDALAAPTARTRGSSFLAPDDTSEFGVGWGGGWTTLALNTGWTGTVRALVVGGVLFLSGAATPPGGATPAAGMTVLTLPPQMRPSEQVTFVVVVNVSATGVANAFTYALATTGELSITVVKSDGTQAFWAARFNAAPPIPLT